MKHQWGNSVGQKGRADRRKRQGGCHGFRIIVYPMPTLFTLLLSQYICKCTGSSQFSGTTFRHAVKLPLLNQSCIAHSCDRTSTLVIDDCIFPAGAPGKSGEPCAWAEKGKWGCMGADPEKWNEKDVGEGEKCKAIKEVEKWLYNDPYPIYILG
jgi:hypothetical protein